MKLQEKHQANAVISYEPTSPGEHERHSNKDINLTATLQECWGQDPLSVLSKETTWSRKP